MSIEWCNKAQVMNYLFKYVTEGPDCSKLYLQRIKGKGVPVSSDGPALAQTVISAQGTSAATGTDILDAPASSYMPTSTVDPKMLLLQTPPLVAKPPGPSGGKGEIDSHVKRSMFTESSPEQVVVAVEELAPQVLSEELGLPLSNAPDSPLAPSVAPSMDKPSTRLNQQWPQPDGAGKKKKV